MNSAAHEDPQKPAGEDQYRENGMKAYADRASLWCKYDVWTLDEAAALLSGILPKNDEKGCLFDPTYLSNTETPPLSIGAQFHQYSVLKSFSDNLTCLKQVTEILHRSAIGDRASPKQWAEYARAKGLLPHEMYLTLVDNSPLLALLEPSDATEPISQSGMEPVAQLAQPYSTSWLTIQNAAIAQFFNPRRNPDPKREEVIEWINAKAEKTGLRESQNIAKAIFTIIKPENHDPKKRRDEPQ